METSPSTGRRIPPQLKVAALLAVAAFDIHAGNSILHPDKPAAPAATPVERTMPKLATECPAPSLKARQEVDELFSRPRDPQAVAAYNAKAEHVNAEMAALDTIPTNNPVNTARFLKAAERILRPNVIAVTPTGFVHHGNKAHPTFEKVIATKTGRSAVEDGIKGLALLPSSYVRYSGLKQVMLGTSRYGGYTALTTSNSKDQPTIVLDLNYPGGSEVAAHEMGHVVDGQECGLDNMYSDPAYERLNRHRKVYLMNYKARLKQSHSLENLDLYFKLADLEGLKREDFERHDMAGFKKHHQKEAKLLASVDMVSDYSQTNPVEDKAEIDMHLALPSKVPEVLNRSTPTIRKKFIFLMARLYEKAPGTVREFAAIAQRSGGGEEVLVNHAVKFVAEEQRRERRQRQTAKGVLHSGRGTYAGESN